MNKLLAEIKLLVEIKPVWNPCWLAGKKIKMCSHGTVSSQGRCIHTVGLHLVCGLVLLDFWLMPSCLAHQCFWGTHITNSGYIEACTSDRWMRRVPLPPKVITSMHLHGYEALRKLWDMKLPYFPHIQRTAFFPHSSRKKAPGGLGHLAMRAGRKSGGSVNCCGQNTSWACGQTPCAGSGAMRQVELGTPNLRPHAGSDPRCSSEARAQGWTHGVAPSTTAAGSGPTSPCGPRAPSCGPCTFDTPDLGSG